METVAAEITQESDTGLVLLMGAAGESSAEDRAVAIEALRLLHSRHYEYLVGVLEGFAENLGTVVIDPEEFALKTFKKAFQVAFRFCDQSGGDAIKARVQVRAWLGKIARNLARDELDRVSRLDKHIHLVVLDETHDIPVESEDDGDITPTESKALDSLKTALAKLKPEERDIVITYAEFGVPTKNGRELPEDVREALMQRTGYERSNVRQKWCRLTKQLHADLEPFLKNQNQSSLCKTKLHTQATR